MAARCFLVINILAFGLNANYYWLSDGQENNTHLLITSFLSLIITIWVALTYQIRLEKLTKYYGALQLGFHMIFQTFALADIIPGLTLDTAKLAKFDYLQTQLTGACLIANI
jgi:uncharacterized membrane protein YwzB